MFLKNKAILLVLSFLFLGLANLSAQTTVINDALNGSTVGSKVGGSFTSEGYKPGIGKNHILYTVPASISNGYVEFEMKGFSPGSLSGTKNDHAFIMMYDGRGIGNTPTWAELRDNFFRWNFHWKYNTGNFKSVVNVAAPTSKRLNASYAIFNTDENKDGQISMLDRDWFDEPSGSSFSWNTSRWYKVKLEWKNKDVKVYVDGSLVWANHKTGLYDYLPKDFKIWLGSAVDKYDSDNGNVVYRNFKVVSNGGSTTTKFLSVSPSNQNVSAAAGNTTFSVSSNISWSATDNASWLSLSNSSGSNSGDITANFTENTSTSSRTAEITVSGEGFTKKVTVTQEGKSSSTDNFLNVSPSSSSVASSAGNTSFGVSSNVSWTASENTSWLTISAGSGSNNGNFTATFTENTSTSSRSAIVTVSGGGISKQVTVIQAGKTSSGSEYLNVPATLNVSNSAGEMTIDVSSNVSWTVRDNTSNPDWLNKAPKTGNGNGKVQVSWQANTGANSRTGQLIWESGSITKITIVTQSKSATNDNFLSVTPSNQNVSSAPGNVSFSVSSNISWTVSGNASWLTFASNSGSNNGNILASFSENTSSSSRSAQVTVSGSGLTKNVTVTQAGKSSSGSNFIDVPATLNVSNSAGEMYIDVKSDVSWSVRDNTSNPDWLNKAPKTGSGNGRVKVSWLKNSDNGSRTGQLIWQSGSITKTTTVTQGQGQTDSQENFLNVPTSFNVSNSAGEMYIDVSSNVTWSVRDNTSNPDWLNKAPKTGTGNGKVKVSWLKNSGSNSRTGQLIWTSGSMTKVTSFTQSGSNSSLAKQDASQMEEKKEEFMPTEFGISNYPNPFNPSTTIQFDLPKAGFTELVVFNSIGQEVIKLVSEYKNAGRYNILFDASNYASGVYFSKLTVGKFVKTNKLLLLE